MKRSGPFAACCAVLLAVALGHSAHAQDGGSRATTFATLPAPSGILVNASGDVDVVSDPPGGTHVVKFHADGSQVSDSPLGSTPPDLYAHSRLAWIDRSSLEGVALLTHAGLLHVELKSVADPIELDLSKTEPLQAADLDAGGTPAQLTFAGAGFDDVAVAPALPQAVPPGAQPAFDAFVTGATAARPGGAASRPFLLRVHVDPEGNSTVRAIATTQGAVADPAHRSGVGAFVAPSPNPPPPRPPVLIFAALPTKASAATPNAVDTLVSVGENYPDDPSADAPKIVLNPQGTPATLTCRGMTNDRGGTLFMLAASDACSPGGGPGVVAVTVSGGKTASQCIALPPPAGPTGAEYVDLATGKLGDPVYVTNEKGGVVLALPGLPAASASGMASNVERGSVGEDVGFAMGARAQR